MKVFEGLVRNLLKLTFLKRNIKFVELGLTTRLDERLFQGWTTRQEKKCLEILYLAMGTVIRRGWPRVLEFDDICL